MEAEEPWSGVSVSGDGVILPEYLPPNIAHPEEHRPTASQTPNRSLEEMERDHIQAVLRLTSGNRTRAAEILGISQATLWRKLKERNHATTSGSG